MIIFLAHHSLRLQPNVLVLKRIQEGSPTIPAKISLNIASSPKKLEQKRYLQRKKNCSRSSAPSSLVEASWVMEEYFGHGGIHQEERKY
jgi:hypothetical protein